MANFPKIKIGLTFSDPDYNYVIVHMDQYNVRLYKTWNDDITLGILETISIENLKNYLLQSVEE